MKQTDKSKTAIILGASGLVGSFLLYNLIDGDAYDRVIALARKDLGVDHPKLITHVVDFGKPETYGHLIQGDDLFCCLGITIAQAGSKEAFRKVDYEYPVQFAQAARRQGISQYLMVSSVGADPRSSAFYLKTKGECEEAVAGTEINSVSIFRPASLSGNRKDFRLAERISLPILKLLSPLLVGKLRKYRPIEARQVARAMYNVSQSPEPGCTIYESDHIQLL